MRDVSSAISARTGRGEKASGARGNYQGLMQIVGFVGTNGQALKKLLEWAHRRLNGCQPRLVVGQVDNTTNRQSHQSTTPTTSRHVWGY